MLHKYKILWTPLRSWFKIVEDLLYIVDSMFIIFTFKTYWYHRFIFLSMASYLCSVYHRPWLYYSIWPKMGGGYYTIYNGMQFIMDAIAIFWALWCAAAAASDGRSESIFKSNRFFKSISKTRSFKSSIHFCVDRIESKKK